MELKAIQSALREAKLEGWLFYDHHRRDPIAYRVLKINPVMCTRRWYYLVPAAGDPAKLVHRIESEILDELPGTKFVYSGWTEQRAKMREMLNGKRRLAMQYSPLNDIPYIGLVDAGTIDLVKSFDVEVVSSGDLVQLFEARWSPEALESHLAAGKGVHAAVNAAFDFIRKHASQDQKTHEYAVQQEILRVLAENGLRTEEAPIVAVNAHTGNPHYAPDAGSSLPMGRDDFVLLDVWAKLARAGSVYFDITWTGYVAKTVPSRYSQVFETVRDARDAAIELVKRSMQAGKPLRGCDVDDVAREVVGRSGYGEYFVHRTGHSIGEDIHGSGANLDNFETRDTRRLVPRTCFSVEPGIYLSDFGVRTEVNVYVEEHDARVTGEMQDYVVAILA